MRAEYGLALRMIHWSTAALVAMGAVLALLNALLYEPRPILAEALVQGHIAVGVMVLLLTLLRMVLRVMRSVPLPPGGPVRRRVARLVHASLYAVLIVIPVSGYVKLAALGFQINVLGVLPLPALPLNVPLAFWAERCHTVAAAALGALLVLHIAGAVSHRPQLGPGRDTPAPDQRASA